MLFVLFSIVVVILSTLATARSWDTSETRIVGGVETTIDRVPYLVNLRLNGQFICGGSLVTPRCVLTAAHCVYGSDPSTLTVHAGASRLSEVAETRSVEQHYVSPFYSPVSLDMDVAILRLAGSPLTGPDVAGATANVATVPLCSSRPGDNEPVQISGWGITDETGRIPPDQVRTTYVRTVSRLQCGLAYAGKALLTSTMFCATVPGERDSCSGDSGGPVVYRGQVCGIVSWGFGCARAQYPGVYTNVSSRRVNAFVRQIIGRNCS